MTELSNTNILLLPAAQSVATLLPAALAALVVEMVSHTQNHLGNQNDTVADTLRVLAQHVYGPARNAVVALAVAIDIDGQTRRASEKNDCKPGFFDTDDWLRIVELSEGVEALLTALRDAPESAGPGPISLANAL